MEVEPDNTVKQKMEDCYMRYMRLHAIVEEINAKPLGRTTEWYAEHNRILNIYIDHFKGGFEDINPEITDLEFRSNCRLLDILLNKLVTQYRIYGWFSLYDYLQFNQITINLVDSISNSMDAEDDVCSMFSNLKV